MIVCFFMWALGAFLGVFLTYRINRKDRWLDTGDKVFFMALFGSIGFLAGVLLSYVLSIILATISPTYHVESRNGLVTLQDGTSVSGRFFLGSGSVDGKPGYTYYRGDGVNGFSLESVAANKAIVKYSTEAPRVEKILTCGPGLFSNSCVSSQYVFYVPEGSVKQDYTLDAK